MKYIISLNGKDYEVLVEHGKANIISEEVSSSSFSAQAPVIYAEKEDIPSDGNFVNAPLSGVIVNIFVRPGQTVKHGDVLLVLEAMKMENELMAPADGVISAILCTSGTNVNMGDPLIEMI